MTNLRNTYFPFRTAHCSTRHTTSHHWCWQLIPFHSPIQVLANHLWRTLYHSPFDFTLLLIHINFSIMDFRDSNECRLLSSNSQRHFIVGDCCKVFLNSWHAVLNCFHRFSQFQNIQTSYSTQRLDTKLTKKPLGINICTTLHLILIPISKDWLCMNKYFSGQLHFSGTALQDMTSQMTVSTLSCL